jgi:hypothetical protein
MQNTIAEQRGKTANDRSFLAGLGSSRRDLLKTGALLAASTTLVDGAPTYAQAHWSDPMVPVPLPAQVPAKEI